MLSLGEFLAALGTGAFAVGSDPRARTWVEAARAGTCASFDGVPPLVGALPPDAGEGLLIMFPQRRSTLTRLLFAIRQAGGRTSSGINDSPYRPDSDPAFTWREPDGSRRGSQRAHSIGGTRYPLVAIDFSRDDRIARYGDMWPKLVRLRQRFAADNILAAGPRDPLTRRPLAETHDEMPHHG